jgi:pimeloyl-CoA synthetase
MDVTQYYLLLILKMTTRMKDQDLYGCRIKLIKQQNDSNNYITDTLV